MYKNSANFGTLMTIAGGSITTSYQLIGTTTAACVEITFKNITDGDVFVSTDGVNNMLDLPTQSYTDKDVRTNAPQNTDLVFSIGTDIFIKSGTVAPTNGRFSVETIVAKQLES